MLVHKYELFKIEYDESITEMFTHFTDIINGLKSLGKSYTNSELVRKILRSLPRTWEAKVTAIQEAKDLNTLPLEELLGSLMTHELSMKQHQRMKSKRKEPLPSNPQLRLIMKQMTLKMKIRMKKWLSSPENLRSF